MKVLSISTLSGSGNISKSDVFKWRLLTKEHDYCVVTISDEIINDLDFIDIYKFKRSANPLVNILKLNFASLILIIYNKVKGTPFDCVLSQDPSRAILITLYNVIAPFFFISLTPVISEFHGDATNQFKTYKGNNTLVSNFVGGLYNKISNYVVSKSNSVRLITKSGIEYLPSKHPAKIFIIPPYVDQDFFDVTPFPLSSKKKSVLFVGNHHNLKNGKLLISQFCNSLLPSLGYELNFYGDGVHKSEWISFYNDLNKLDNFRVNFFDYINHIELINILQQSQILVLPSTTEGFGRVLIEAMLCNVVCVGSDVGGIPDVIINEGLGYLFPIKEQNSLQYIFDNISKHGIDTEILNNARAYALDNFSPIKYSHLINNMINESAFVSE